MSKKNSNKRFILGLAVAFLLPLSFYLVTLILSKDKVHLPKYYITESIDSQLTDGKMVYDTIHHQTRDLELINQLGREVSLNTDLQGKILVVDFFFTHCPTVCPRLTGNMAFLQKAFKKDKKKQLALDTMVHFVSISVDPERDSVPALRAYAERYNTNHDKWWFLTGSKPAIYDFARNELALSVQPGDGGPHDVIHTQKIVLLDQQRYIRGYYDGLDTLELNRCAEDIVLLSLEKKHEGKR